MVFDFTENEANFILNVLAEKSYKDTFEIIGKMMTQANAQKKDNEVKMGGEK